MKVEFSPNFDARQRRWVHTFSGGITHLVRVDSDIADDDSCVAILDSLVEIEDSVTRSPFCFEVLRALFQGQRVILKSSASYSEHHDDPIAALQLEAENYRTKWTGLQKQRIIPKYLGFFRQAEGSDRRIACLMLEDCGSEPEVELMELTHEDK